MKLIYILGIDGSGKTTLAKNLVRRLNSKVYSFHYCYAQHIPFLLKPLKLIAKKSLLKSTDEFQDYSYYMNMKKSYSKKLLKLSYIYGFIWLLDYFCRTSIKIYYHHLLRHNLIVDRYFLDMVVNISETLVLNDSQMMKFAKLVAKLFPAPSKFYFIDIPEKEAYVRKNDIQSIQYLTERRDRYKKLSDVFDFIYLDGTNSPDELVKTVLSSMLPLKI